MKKIKNNLLRSFVIILLVSIAYSVEASSPPPPPGGSSGSGNVYGNSLGAGAPIAGGLFILLGLAAAYGGRKIIQLRKEDLKK